MKKIINLLLVAVLLLFTGCKEEKKASGNSDSKEITFVSWTADNNEWEEILKAFNIKYPDIKVKHVIYPSNEYETKLKILLTGGGDVDVFIAKSYDFFTDLSYRNQLTSLNDKISQSAIETENYGNYYNAVRINGQVYGLPYKTSREVLYYNKKMFDEKGIDYPENINYEDFREIAQKLSEGRGADKKYGAMLNTWTTRSQWYGLQSGDTIVDEDLSSFAKGLQMRIDMEDEGSMFKYNDMVSTGLHYSSAFSRGNIGMLLIGDWAIGMFKKAESEGKINFDWGVTTLPKIKEGTNSSFGTIYPVMIPKNSKNQDSAWKFTEFLTTEEGQKIIAKNNIMPGYMSPEVRKSYQEAINMEDLDKILQANVFMDKPSLPGMAIVDKIYQEEFSLVYAREIGVKEAFDRIKKRIKNELNN